MPRSPRVAAVQAPAGYGFPTAADDLLAWSDAEHVLRLARTFWLGTVLPSHRPYATPLWAVWIDDSMYFDGMPTTRWARNIKANPEIEMHAEADGRVAMLAGRAHDVTTDADLGERIITAWLEKYGRGEPEPVRRGLFRLRPDHARAWSETMTDGTRWTFGPGEER